MTTTTTVARSIRAAIFDTLEQADYAVTELLKAGFTKEQITVICSDKAIERHFTEFEHQDPAGTHTPQAALRLIRQANVLPTRGLPACSLHDQAGQIASW